VNHHSKSTNFLTQDNEVGKKTPCDGISRGVPNRWNGGRKTWGEMGGEDEKKKWKVERGKAAKNTNKTKCNMGVC